MRRPAPSWTSSPSSESASCPGSRVPPGGGALSLASCSQGNLPQSPLLKWLERPSGRIAYVGLDGKSLAFVSVHQGPQGPKDTAVWTAQAGASPRKVYASEDHVARYLSWSPDSTRLVFAAGPGDEVRELDTVPALGGAVRVLDSGTGFAWRWEAGGARLAVHSVDINEQADVERVRILDSLGGGEATQLAQEPGNTCWISAAASGREGRPSRHRPRPHPPSRQLPDR